MQVEFHSKSLGDGWREYRIVAPAGQDGPGTESYVGRAAELMLAYFVCARAANVAVKLGQVKLVAKLKNLAYDFKRQQAGD